MSELTELKARYFDLAKKAEGFARKAAEAEQAMKLNAARAQNAQIELMELGQEIERLESQPAENKE